MFKKKIAKKKISCSASDSDSDFGSKKKDSGMSSDSHSSSDDNQDNKKIPKKPFIKCRPRIDSSESSGSDSDIPKHPKKSSDSSDSEGSNDDNIFGIPRRREPNEPSSSDNEKIEEETSKLSKAERRKQEMI